MTASTYLEAITGPYIISFLRPSHFPWEYTVSARYVHVAHLAKSITRTISVLTGTRLLLDDEKQVKCLA